MLQIKNVNFRKSSLELTHAIRVRTPLGLVSSLYLIISLICPNTLFYFAAEPLLSCIRAPKRFHIGYFPCALESFFAWPENNKEAFLNMLTTFLFRRMVNGDQGNSDTMEDMARCRKEAEQIFRKCGDCLSTLDRLQVPFRNMEVPQRLLDTIHPNPAYLQFHPYTDHTLMETDANLVADVMSRLHFQPTMANFIVKARLEMEYRYANLQNVDGVGDFVPRELFHFTGGNDVSKQVVCLYLLGHGVNQATADRILAQVKIDHAFYSAFHSDLIEEFQKLGSACSVGKIIAGSLLLSVEELIIDFYKGVSTQKNKNKHLILISDFCFSGGVLEFQENTLVAIQELKKLDCFVYIQTSSSSTQSSRGYFFTPLFYQLQRLSADKYKELRRQFAATEPNVVRAMLESCHQVPCFYTSNDAVSSAKSEISIHGVRMFRDPEFFAFMADAWQKQTHSLVPFSIRTDPSIATTGGEIGLERFPFTDASGEKHFADLLKDFSAAASHNYKVRIMGVLLFFDAKYNKPEAICGFRSPRWKASHIEEFYLLHIHFDRGNPFPGLPTSWKVITGVWQTPRDTQNANGVLIDSELDATYGMRSAGNFAISDELIATIARYVDHHEGQGFWCSEVNWRHKKKVGQNTIRNRNVALINLSSHGVPFV